MAKKKKKKNSAYKVMLSGKKKEGMCASRASILEQKVISTNPRITPCVGFQ